MVKGLCIGLFGDGVGFALGILMLPGAARRSSGWVCGVDGETFPVHFWVVVLRLSSPKLILTGYGI